MEVEEQDVNSSSEEVEEGEPLATTRSRRSNAGNRMGNLIQEEDDFYNNTYGGFNDEEDDGDFDSDDEADEDEVDSDFSIDETDEIAPEHQVVEEESRKRKNIYKDPKPKVQRGPLPAQEPSKASSSGSTIPQSPSKHRPERSFRDSTKKKTAETIKNIETGKRRRKFRNIEPHRKLTQEELLEEAKKTEEENIKSLEIYQRLESEKLKKIKMIKRSLPAPYTTYYSSIFTNPETKERYSRNLCTYVGCEPKASSIKTKIQVTSRGTRCKS